MLQRAGIVIVLLAVVIAGSVATTFPLASSTGVVGQPLPGLLKSSE